MYTHIYTYIFIDIDIDNSNSHGARPVHQKHLRHDEVDPDKLVVNKEFSLSMRTPRPRPSPPTCTRSTTLSTQGSSWGYLKSQCLIDLVNFWRQMPTKWLQERVNGSKNGSGIPPHRAFCGYVGAFHDTIKSGGTKNEGYQAANTAAYGPGGG